MSKKNTFLITAKKIAKHAAILALLALASCTAKPNLAGWNTQQNVPTTQGSAAAKTTGPAIGARNFQTVYANMLANTGVVPPPGGQQATDAINMAYNRVSSLFSINGGMGYSAPMAFAALQLALPVCQAAIKGNTLPLPASMNPNTTTNTDSNVSTAQEQTTLVQALCTWNPNPSELAAILSGLAAEVANPPTTTTTTNGVVTATTTLVSPNARLGAAVLFACIACNAAPQAISNYPASAQ